MGAHTNSFGKFCRRHTDATVSHHNNIGHASSTYPIPTTSRQRPPRRNTLAPPPSLDTTGTTFFSNVFKKFFTGIARILAEFSTPFCFVFSNPPRVSGGASVRAISPPALSPYWRGGSAHVLPGATLSYLSIRTPLFRRRYQKRIVPPIIRTPPYASANNRL